MQFNIIKILGGYEYTFIYISDLKYIHNNKMINMLIQRNSAICFILRGIFLKWLECPWNDQRFRSPFSIDGVPQQPDEAGRRSSIDNIDFLSSVSASIGLSQITLHRYENINEEPLQNFLIHSYWYIYWLNLDLWYVIALLICYYYYHLLLF